MNMISITGSATASRGYTYDDATEMLDLFDAVLEGRATSKTLHRMLAITSAAMPITASARRSMKPVRLDADKTRAGLASVSDKFWKAYRAKHPQPEQKRQTVASTMRRRGS